MDGLAQEAAGDDWLSVNVWSPDPAPGAGLPVLVWIPGGGYVIGTSGLPEFDGGRLAAGGVVVVTLNYRLGVEGFAQIDGAPANRWVRDNIRAFGGDARRVRYEPADRAWFTALTRFIPRRRWTGGLRREGRVRRS